MIALKTYQTEAVEELVKNTYKLLQMPGARHKMVFKAPTGAGKTVTMAAYLNMLCEELPDRLDVTQKQVAFIWIAPNQLHLQSFKALQNYFAELRSIKPIQFEDVTDGRIKPNEVLFLNWQKISGKDRILTRENEAEKTLISYINQARLYDTEIVLILDEEHLFSGAPAATEITQQIYAKIEIGVSATPRPQTVANANSVITINRHEVVKAEMIKQGIILNPALDAHNQQGRSLEQVLLELSLQKKKDIQLAYQKLDININPLLLIQLPNDTKTESTLDIKIKQTVETWLEAKGITTKNNRLAVWLSNEKTNLDGIEQYDSMVDVLLFKQAISLGWDCPRAAVLLIFREIQQETFTIQTVGRILRMPEQKHYPDALLNYGYVYTDLSKDQIIIVQDDLDYIVQNKALRIQHYQALQLKSYYINTRLNRNRLGSKFKRCFYEAAEEYFKVTLDIVKAGTEGIFVYNHHKLKSKFIDMNVDNIEIPVPKDVHFENEIGVTDVISKVRFAKTQFELDRLFRLFARNHVGGYAKVDSTPQMELAIKMFFEEYLSMNEFQAIKIVLYHQNTQSFIKLIDNALEKHEILLQQKAATASKKVIESAWDVPPEKIYNENYHEKLVATHALVPFYENVSASSPEIKFVKFLENNKDHIEWWYKNGDKNKEDFAVAYEDSFGVTRGFYVDFVIKFKSGKIGLFDTKTKRSDHEAPNKHNALITYIEQQNKMDTRVTLLGGVLIPEEIGGTITFRYCSNRITDTNDLKGWDFFNPAAINNA